MPTTSLLIPRLPPRPTLAENKVSIDVEAAALTYKLRKLDAPPPEARRLRQPSMQEHRVGAARHPVEDKRPDENAKNAENAKYDKYDRDAFGIRLPFIPADRQLHEKVYRSIRAFVPRPVHDPVPTRDPGRANGDTSSCEALNAYLRRSNERTRETSVHPSGPAERL